MQTANTSEPLTFRFMITTWGTALAKCRVGVDLSHREVGDRTGVSKNVVKGWEKGRGYPTAQQLKRLYGSIPSLRGYENLLPREQREASIAMPVPNVAPPPVQEIDMPKTFAEALRTARQIEGMTQEELAELVGVGDSSISSWENGVNTPIQDHYEKLLALMPQLAAAPRPPGVKDMAKPGHAGGAATVSIAPVITLPLPEPARVAPPLAVVNDVEAAGIDYARSLARLGCARRDLADLEARARALKAELLEIEDDSRKAEARLRDLTGAEVGSAA